MPKIPVNRIHLYYEEAGRGIPILFAHEFAGDWRSWEPQVRFFSGRYRAITFSARGYLPSDVPDSPGRLLPGFAGRGPQRPAGRLEN